MAPLLVVVADEFRQHRSQVLLVHDDDVVQALAPYGADDMLGRHNVPVALFLTKVHSRILRPGLRALDLRITSQAPPPLRSAYTALDSAIQQLANEAKLAA